MISEMLELKSVIAPFGKRSAAFLVDAALGYGSAIVLWIVFHNWLFVVGLLYMLLKDGVGGRSLGKLVFGLQTVDLNTGNACNIPQSASRNLPLALVVFCPVELIVAAMSPESFRIGDYLAGTIVIETARIDEHPVEEAVDLSHPTEGLDRLSEITGMDVDSAWRPSDDSMVPVEPSQRLTPSAHLTLNVPPEAGPEAVDDAFWTFMNRFSEDIVRELSPEELDQRCRELQHRFRQLDMTRVGVTEPYDPKMDDDEKREFIRRHVVAVTSARDELTQ
jgi:uncharacterized RDD family membrane protein YckC